MKFKDTIAKLSANCVVILLWKLSNLIFPKVVSEKTILQGERMGYLELFPSDDATSANLVRLNLKSTVFETEHVGFLRENPWQKSNDRPW